MSGKRPTRKVSRHDDRDREREAASDATPDAIDETATQQPALFDMVGRSAYSGAVSSIGALTAESPVPVARWWYRRHLEQGQTPRNTVESYLYDLAIFEKTVTARPINTITARDIARYLGDANTRSTRKRRLTSVSQFFAWLVNGARMLQDDPTASFYPDHIPLKTPRPLFSAEQQALLDAGEHDSPRASLLIWLLLRLGLTRGEVLQLRPEHIDRADAEHPVVYVYYENARWAGKERQLQATADLTARLETYLADNAAHDRASEDGLLFSLLPQSVNKLVDRVARAAGLAVAQRRISPQTLRDTWAVEMAKTGRDEVALLALLGLADDTRNRLSVRRYVKLAAPPMMGTSGDVECKANNV